MGQRMIGVLQDTLELHNKLNEALIALVTQKRRIINLDETIETFRKIDAYNNKEIKQLHEEMLELKNNKQS